MKYGLTIETGPSIKRETTTKQFIGLDVSLKDTFISVRESDQRIWRGKCPSDPRLIAEAVCKRAPHAKRVVFETGPLSVWFYHALTLEGLPAICIDARHAKAALDMARNKTDANDRDDLAHLADAGFYREVRVKSFDSTLVAARNQLLKMTIQLSNQIRSLMKTFGLIVPKGAGRVFEGHVRSLLAINAELEQIILPVIEAWGAMRARAAELSKQLVASARAWIGLTTQRYQSGEVDYDGHISRRGDNHLCGLLYEAATVILTRTRVDSALRVCGLKLKEKIGFKRAAVAVGTRTGSFR